MPAVQELIAAWATAAGGLAQAGQELAGRLMALGQQRVATREALDEERSRRAEAEGGFWRDTAEATTRLGDQVAAWTARREEQSARLAAEVSRLRERAGTLVRDAVEAVNRLAGAFSGASAAASARWGALDRQSEGIGDFLRLLAREHQMLKEELVALSGLLTRQQAVRQQAGATAIRAAAGTASTAGLRALHRGDLPLAESLFRRAWSLERTAGSRHNLALVLLLAGQQARVAELLAAPGVPEGDPVARQALLAFRAYRDGEFDQARRAAEAGLAVAPGQGVLRQLATAAAARCGATAEALGMSREGSSVLACWAGGPTAGQGPGKPGPDPFHPPRRVS